MNRIRFCTDEDVFGAVAPALRSFGIDAISTPEMNREGASDEQQLEWAAQDSRVVVSFNVSDFADLHSLWLENGRHHSGIVVSNQRPVGEMIRRLKNLANQMDSNEMVDRLEFLGSW